MLSESLNFAVASFNNRERIQSGPEALFAFRFLVCPLHHVHKVISPIIGYGGKLEFITTQL